MADVRDLLVRIKGDTGDFSKSMKGIKGDADAGHMSFLKMTGAVAAGNAIFAVGSAAITGISNVTKGFINDAKENQEVVSQLNAVLKSTGEAAGLTSQDLQDQADALERLTAFSAEAVMGAQSLLLTFTNVKGAVFQEATPLILDMSQALGQDLKSSSIQLGKALNDPIKGITALSRVGVSFTQSQKDMIGKMVEAGDVAGAQRVILKELKTEFGGSAEAAGKTFAGSMERLKNSLGQVTDQIGYAVINGVTPFATKIADFVASDTFHQWVQNTGTFIQTYIKPAFEWLITTALPTLFQWGQQTVELAMKVYNFLKPSLDALFNTVQKDLMPALEKLWKEVIEPLAPIIGAILVGAIWLLINALNIAIGVLSWVIGTLSDFLNWAGRTAVGVVKWFAGIPAGIKSAFSTIWDIVTSPFKAAFNAVARFWNDTMGKVDFKLPDWIPGVGGKGFSLPKIPYLADGGIVDRATLAMIGEGSEPEAVIPLSKIPQMVQQVRGGSQPNTTINLEVNIGMYAGMPVEKREIALDLWKEIVRSARAQGVQLPMIGAVGVQ